MLNLYEVLQKILSESVGENEIIDAINNHNYVDVNYDDGKYHMTGRRLIQPYAYGLTKAGNPCLRAFQMQGDSFRGQPHWKTFLISKFTSWHPRKQTFNMPPPMQGYNTEDYNENGDGSMSKVYVQAKFGNSLDDTLAFVKAQRDFVKNAPKVNSKNTQGPIPFANQQRKKNVFTSQPNSKKYAQYAKNIQDTENEIDRFNDDIWAKAEAEKQQQNDAMLQNSVKKPQQMQQGPINTKNNDDKEKKINNNGN